MSSLLGDASREKEGEEDASGRAEGGESSRAMSSAESEEIGKSGGAGSEAMGPRTAGVSEGYVSLLCVVLRGDELTGTVNADLLERQQ